MDTLVIPPEVQAILRKKKYQKRAYLRRKERAKVLAELRLQERAEALKQSIVDAGGLLQSLPP